MKFFPVIQKTVVIVLMASALGCGKTYGPMPEMTINIIDSNLRTPVPDASVRVAYELADLDVAPFYDSTVPEDFELGNSDHDGHITIAQLKLKLINHVYIYKNGYFPAMISIFSKTQAMTISSGDSLRQGCGQTEEVPIRRVPTVFLFRK